MDLEKLFRPKKQSKKIKNKNIQKKENQANKFCKAILTVLTAIPYRVPHEQIQNNIYMSSLITSLIYKARIGQCQSIHLYIWKPI